VDKIVVMSKITCPICGEEY